MARWLLSSPQPVIVIDWSDLKADKAWCLLRAAVPAGGRTLPILDMVFPGSEAGSPKAGKHFLERLKQIVPEAARPILVTDAGYRTPWFGAVDKLGWHWVGRLRHRTLVKPADVDEKDAWVPSRALYELLDGKGTRDMGQMDTARATPWTCRVVIHRKNARNRKHRNPKGQVVRSTQSSKHELQLDFVGKPQNLTPFF